MKKINVKAFLTQKKKEMSFKDLSKETGISRAMLCQILLENRKPGYSTLLKLAQAFNLSLDDMER